MSFVTDHNGSTYFETNIVTNIIDLCNHFKQELAAGFYYYYYLIDGERRFNFNCPCSTNLDSQTMMNTISISGIIYLFLFLFWFIESDLIHKSMSTDLSDRSDIFSPITDSCFIPSISGSPETTSYLSPTTTTLLSAPLVGNWWTEDNVVAREAEDKAKHHKKSFKAVKRVHFKD